MNYPKLPEKTRPKPRKSNIFFLFVLCFMACFLFMQYKNASARANAYGGAASVPEIVIPDISNDGPVSTESPIGDASAKVDSAELPRGLNGLPVGSAPDTNDWEIEEVETEKSPTEVVIGSSKGVSDSKVSSGDWSLEVAESQPSDTKPTAPNVEPELKTTTKDDWEVSEVETESFEFEPTP